MTNPDARVQAWLASRGVTDTPEGSYRLRDDGAGVYIAAWDEQILGTAPTLAELEVVTDSAALNHQRERAASRQQVIDDPLVRALVEHLAPAGTDIRQLVSRIHKTIRKYREQGAS